jgi:hypothetical protein
MRQDPTYAALLIEKGYRIHTLEGNQKHPSYPEWSKRSLTELKEKFRETSNATGWAIELNELDTHKLVILDIDNYDRSQVEVFEELFPLHGGAIPPEVGVVRSVSGGLHIYMKAPLNKEGESLPDRFEIGSLKGDIRYAYGPARLLLLPGSLAINKSDKTVGEYKLLSSIDPVSLDPIPDSLWKRIKAAEDKSTGTITGAEPSEVSTIKRLMGFIPVKSITHGQWSDLAFHMGKLVGRMWARETPPEAHVQHMFTNFEHTYKTTEEHRVSEQTFRDNYLSGWVQGRANNDKYTPATTHPEEEVVMAEFTALFKSTPWCEELTDMNGKRVAFVLGLGSPGTGEREKISSLTTADEVLGLFHRLSVKESKIDLISRSPLFFKPGWFKVLKLVLMGSLQKNSIIADPDEELRGKLLAVTKDAADGGLIGASLRDGQRQESDFWLQRHSAGAYLLLGSPTSMKFMLTALPPECRSYLKQLGSVKRDSVGTLWRIPVENFAEEPTLAYLEQRYIEMLQARKKNA